MCLTCFVLGKCILMLWYVICFCILIIQYIVYYYGMDFELVTDLFYVDPCGAYNFRVKANSVLCVQCGKWIHGRCEKGYSKVFKEISMQKM